MVGAFYNNWYRVHQMGRDTEHAMRMGLLSVVFNAEYPHFDTYAQCDVEGRPRPVHSYGGIDRGPNQSWRTLDPKSKQR